MSENKDAQYREECREAIKVFDESGALATNMVPDNLRHAYFRAGYLAGRKKCQEEKEEWIKDYCRVCGKNDDLEKQITLLKKELEYLKSINNSQAKYVQDEMERSIALENDISSWKMSVDRLVLVNKIKDEKIESLIGSIL